MKSLRKHLILAAVALLANMILPSFASAQRSELTITINEQFFDALLDATFKHYDPPEFSIASAGLETLVDGQLGFLSSLQSGPSTGATDPVCGTVKVLRENNGFRTAVRFREGKVYVPLAFSGNIAPPFIGCVDFAGSAESVVDLEFDQASQRLLGKVRVTTVNLNGTGGIGGGLVARMLQGSIDKKLNPVEILSLEKLSFGLPIPNTGKINMHAVGVRPEVIAGGLAVHVDYEFLKD